MKYTVNQLLEGQLVFYLALTVSIHHKDHENRPPDELMKKVISRETKVNAEVTEVSLTYSTFAVSIILMRKSVKSNK